MYEDLEVDAKNGNAVTYRVRPYINDKGNQRRISVTIAETGGIVLDMDAERAQKLSVILYGLSEDHADPIKESELSKRKFKSGSLVKWTGREDGEFKGNTFLVWGESYNKDGLIAVAPRYGGGLYYAPPEDLNFVEYDPNHHVS